MKEIKVTAVNHKMETVTVTPTAVGVNTITGEYGTSHTYTVTREGYVTKTGTWTATKNETINVALERQSYTLSVTVPNQSRYTGGALKINGTAVTVSSNKYTGTFKYGDSVKIEYSANGIAAYTNTITIPASNHSVDLTNLVTYNKYNLVVNIKSSTGVAIPVAVTTKVKSTDTAEVSKTGASFTLTGLKYGDKVTATSTASYYNSGTKEITITGNNTLDVALTPINYTLTVVVPEQTKYTSPSLVVAGKTLTITSNKATITATRETSMTLVYKANGIDEYKVTLAAMTANRTEDITNKVTYKIYDIGIDRMPSGLTFTYSVNGGPVQTNTSNSIDNLRYNDVVVWNATASGYVSKNNQTITITGSIRLDVVLTPQSYQLAIITPNQTKYTSGVLKINGTAVTVSSNTYNDLFPFGSSIKIEYTANGISTYSNTITMPVGGTAEDISAKAKKLTYVKNIYYTPTNGTFKWEYEGDGAPSQDPGTSAGTCRIGGDLHYGDKIKWALTAAGHTSKSGTITVTSTGEEKINLVPISYKIIAKTSPDIQSSISFMNADTGAMIDGVTNVTTLTASIPYGTRYYIVVNPVATTGYEAVTTETFTVTADITRTITLKKRKVTLTIIPTPSDATVKFS